MNRPSTPFSASISTYKIAIWDHRLIFLVLAFITFGVNAETKTSHSFGNHTVHYSVFNSTMVQPEIASAHKLKRAGNLAYINIAVVENNGKSNDNKNNYGIAAQVSGKARNLLQQQQLLNFVVIEEQTATYYLAPLYYNNEDTYHFDITVVTGTKTPAETFTFTKTLYVE